MKNKTEEQFRQGMASIIAREGKFSMNLMVDLAETYFQNRLKEILPAEKEIFNLVRPKRINERYERMRDVEIYKSGYNDCLKKIKQKREI